MCSPLISKMYQGGGGAPDFSAPPDAGAGASASAGAGPKIEEVD